MLIKLNGIETDLPQAMSVAELIVWKGLNPSSVVIEINLEIVRKDGWQQVCLQENDVVEVLTFVGGG